MFLEPAPTATIVQYSDDELDELNREFEKLPASSRAAGQPTFAIAWRARSGARSATPTRAMPGVRSACDRYIEPNLPAPIRPTRRGLPAASRASKSLCRFTGAPQAARASGRSAILTDSSSRQLSASGTIGVKSRWAM